MVVTVGAQAFQVIGMAGFGLVAHPARGAWVALALGLVLGNLLGLQLSVLTILRAVR
jgi:hypothetical protein